MTTNSITTADDPIAATISGWARIKADYLAAEAAVNLACERQMATEEKLVPFWRSQPETVIAYTEDAWSNGTVSVSASERTIKIKPHNIKGDYLPEQVRDSDEFRAFCERVGAWQKEPDYLSARSAYDEADKATSVAMDEQRQAWAALVAFPLADAASIADKLDTASPYADDDPECCKALIRAISADLHRVGA